MKKVLLIALLVVIASGLAMAQLAPPTSDILGAHLNYGRGCAACHAPHSASFGNGANKSGDTSVNSFLWGQDVGNLYGKTIVLSGATAEQLPASFAAGTPDVSGVLLCLSCHDGNWAQGAMMKNKVFETLPTTYGSGTIPTLLGNEGVGLGNYTANHPVGLNAVIACGAANWNWDCTNNNGTMQMTGTNSAAFVKNYGFFVKPTAYNGNPIVLCTTCHNQHIMNTVAVSARNSGLPAGQYQTMFFLVGPYNPASTTANSNQTAQFCRQCHGSEGNESNGSLVIPTTF